jgi:hypothetical protein
MHEHEHILSRRPVVPVVKIIRNQMARKLSPVIYYGEPFFVARHISVYVTRGDKVNVGVLPDRPDAEKTSLSLADLRQSVCVFYHGSNNSGH